MNDIKTIVVEDEPLALRHFVNQLSAAVPTAEIVAFSKPVKAEEYARDHEIDIAFLDIEMPVMSGIELAKRLKKMNHKINIIFTTGYSDYAMEALAMHASGYLLKPITADRILQEVENLRIPLSRPVISDRKLRVQTFGNFEVFSNGMPVSFSRSKSKEILAYLIDRRGATVSMAELASVLWEDKEYETSLVRQMHTYISDMIKSLQKAGVDNVIIKSRNSLAVNIDELSCDYYDFLKGKAQGINAFHDEYMTNYSWAEFTLGNLNNNKDY